MTASKEQIKQGKVRFEAGDILESDYLLCQVQYENDINNKLKATISHDNSLDMLKKLMSLDLSQYIEIIYPNDSILGAMGTMTKLAF